MSETTTIRNGIDVDQLLATIGAVKDDPQVGSFTFRASSRWEDGTYNVGEIGRFRHAGQEDESRTSPFSIDGDEPPVLLGSNKAPNAAARGIEVTSMEYDVEGDVDVQTFLGLERPRAGFTQIRVASRVSSPNATDEQLQELCRYVQDTSPVRDCLANPVPVTTTLAITH